MTIARKEMLHSLPDRSTVPQSTRMFVMYAGYHADNSYQPLTRLAWDEKESYPKSAQGEPLVQHCDIYDSNLMQQVVDAVHRPWSICSVKEMWVSTMPGTKEVSISLVIDGKRPSNYPLDREDSKRVLDLVNSWQDVPCMTSDQLKEIHLLHGESDIEMLKILMQCCNEEDKEEVSLLLYLNDTVGIGWGEPSAPEYEKEYTERESEYFERKFALLKKYDSAKSWEND